MLLETDTHTQKITFGYTHSYVSNIQIASFVLPLEWKKREKPTFSVCVCVCPSFQETVTLTWWRNEPSTKRITRLVVNKSWRVISFIKTLHTQHMTRPHHRRRRRRDCPDPQLLQSRCSSPLMHY